MLTVETHSLESLNAPGPWPPQVVKICELLELALPSWLPYPSETSSGTRTPFHSSVEVTVNSGLDHELKEEEFHQNSLLREFYPFAMHTVAAVKTSMRLDGHKNAWPFVRGYTRVLAVACAPDVVLLSHPAFVRPQLATAHHDSFDGIAEILACHVVEGFKNESFMLHDEQPSSEATRSVPADSIVASTSRQSQDPGSGKFSGSYKGSIEESPLDHSSDEQLANAAFPQSEGTQSSSSGESINVSLNGHIFQGQGRHLHALLPFLCIADEENIIEVVSSVACQRFVWGISEPAIGFQFSPSGTVMKLVLAWVDQSSRVLHVAHGIDHQSGIGVFDFDSIASTLRFTQFLSNLSPSFSAVASSASCSCENIRFDWRLDRPTPSDFKSGVHHINEWVRHVESFSGSPPPRSESPAVDSNTEIGANSESVPSIASESSDPRTSTESAISSDNDSDDFSLDDIYNSAIESLAYYAADRGVRFLSRLWYPEEMFGAEGTEINHHLALYDELTRFQWFPPEAHFPSLVGVLRKYEDTLLKDIQSRVDDSLPPPLILKTEHQTIIAQRIFTLFYTSAGAEIPRGRAESISDDYKDRHDWDALLLSFYVANERDLVSHNVLFERTIHYPKNQLVEEMDGAKLAIAVEQEMKWSAQFYSLAQAAAADQIENHPDLFFQAQLASIQVFKLWNSYLSGCEPLQALLRKRSWHEPATGICDALCFFTISSPVGQDEKAARALEFITCSKADASTDLILPESEPPSFKGKTLFPYFIVEYKKRDDTAGKALDQGRLDLMALISFYAALGILDFSFYVLVTDGWKGAILMGWKSTKSERIYIVERNVVHLDISTPIGSYQFAIFLLRLQDKQKDLEVKAKAKLADANLDFVKFQEWRKEWQAERLDKEWGPAEAATKEMEAGAVN
ncbi:hypothetical protein R3P38DRAFT_3207920 [Favolaschia claudopus]|uniref:Uncharacterized protein n=1 Tax=Favolaschia claudopus TaxID=2862362 RepID=A0AAW0AK09_9AGAR